MEADPPPANPRLRILHLEDSPADCGLVREAVQEAGLQGEFTHATTRHEFVGALMCARFDLILSDHRLPDYDGASALLQARELHPDTPFIIVSGTVGEERAVQYLLEGASDCVLKDRLARLGPAIRRARQVAQDRLERRHAEAARQASEARFREMAENIREVFWSASADGRIINYVSPAYERIWGRSIPTLLAHPAEWAQTLHAEDRVRVEEARRHVIRGTPCDHEYRILQPDGTCRWIEEHVYPVPGRQGEVEHMVGVARDITERKQLEEQLLQAQKMESIGQLAGGIAHDFSNMLTVINGYSNLLLDHPELPPAIAASLRHIYVAGGRAAALTRQLLIFSRKSEAHHLPVDLNALVTDVSTMLRRMIGENIRLELDLARPLPPALADASMLEQVLMNLVVNARDALPKGGALLISTGSCETTSADCLRHPGARPGRHLWLGVRDTGSGIPPEILPRIFEPFFTTKDAGKGTGLGLATVFGIAQQHQGWVEVESELGQGTFFRVLLPIAASLPTTLQRPADTLNVPGGEETILLVEDEPDVREFARIVLQMQGYRVLEAGSGVEALDTWKWHSERIALLLTDLVMPDEMTGLELADKLQAEQPGLKVLFTSGYNPEAARQNLRSRQNFAFLQKPYQPKTLARIVREVLDGRLPSASSSRAPFA